MSLLATVLASTASEEMSSLCYLTLALRLSVFLGVKIESFMSMLVLSLVLWLNWGT